MSLQIQEVDVARARDLLLPFLRQNLPAHATPGYYDWLYLGNPHGRARAWVAQDERGSLVGAAAAFPRLMRVRGEEIAAWNLGDFAIRKEYRTLGPALALQRACLEQVLAGESTFAYDHPSCGMMAVYRRLGLSAVGDVVRFAKPLRVDAQVERRLRPGLLARAAQGLGNAWLALVDRAAPGGRRYEVRALEGRFDDRVLAVDLGLGGRCEVMGLRSAEYLNWRYLDNPVQRYAAALVEGDAGLAGYVTYRVEDGTAVLADLAVAAEDGPAAALVRYVVAQARRRELLTLSAPLLAQSALQPILSACGFRARESTPFVVSTRPGGRLGGIVTEMANWFLTDGDRDV